MPASSEVISFDDHDGTDGWKGSWLDSTSTVDLGYGEEMYDDYLDFDHPNAPVNAGEGRLESLVSFYHGTLEEERRREKWEEDQELWEDGCYNCSTWTCPDDRCSYCDMPPIHD